MMYVCVCESLNEKEIIELIKSGHNTLEKLEQVAKIGARCKLCVPDVKRLLNEFK